ncbi:MAG: hypothetical protein V7697_24970, partial [Rhodococcus erythropolis]
LPWSKSNSQSLHQTQGDSSGEAGVGCVEWLCLEFFESGLVLRCVVADGTEVAVSVEDFAHASVVEGAVLAAVGAVCGGGFWWGGWFAPVLYFCDGASGAAFAFAVFG